jgi:4-hydroxybenzoate polyprenyltransferase
MTGDALPVQSSGLGARLTGLLLVTHPIPSAMYVVAVGLFSPLAAVAAHRTLAIGSLAQVLLAVACTQMAIGATNDYRDREIDARSRPEKPLVRGLIEPWHAVALASVASMLVGVLMAPLGVLPLLLGVLIEGLGLAYDLGLKGTPASALLYAIYFPLIPLLAWTVFGQEQAFLPWLLPVGAILGVAMNVANSLPDLEEDRAAGVRGLPHLLGMRRSLAAAWGLPIIALAVMWLLAATGAAPAHAAGLLAASTATLAATATAIALYRTRPTPATLRTTFYIQAVGVVAAATGWLWAVAF